MAIYQTSKQLTKFGIVGVTAVMVDFIFYYIFSQFLDINLSKALGFASGTFVTYNLNKFWTWRQTEKSSKRLMLFLILYAVAMLINIAVNSFALKFLPKSEFLINFRTVDLQYSFEKAMKADKLFAFVIATVVTSIFNFLGQKYWVFKEADEVEQELEKPIRMGDS